MKHSGRLTALLILMLMIIRDDNQVLGAQAHPIGERL